MDVASKHRSFQLDPSSDAASPFAKPVHRGHRSRGHAASPCGSLNGEKNGSATASNLPAVERGAPSSGRRENPVRDGAIHEPIFGLKSHAFGNEIPDFYWATKDESPTILRVDVEAWNKRDHDFTERFAQLRKDVFIETSETNRQQARLWRSKHHKKSTGVFKPLLKTVELDPRKPKAPHGPRPHHIPQRRPHVVHHFQELPGHESSASEESGARKNSEDVVKQTEEAQESKWAEQRLQMKMERRKMERTRTMEATMNQKQQRLERTKSKLLENLRERRERILQFQRRGIKKQAGQGDQEPKPPTLALPKKVVILSEDPSTGSTAQEPEPTKESEETSGNSDDGDGDSSSADDFDDGEASAEFLKQQERIAGQPPSTRLTRLVTRVSVFHKEERRMKRLEEEEERLLQQDEEEVAPVPTTSFGICVHTAEMYKVPLKVVQESFNHFNQLDTDGNGFLTIDEFEAEIRKMMELGPDDEIPEHLLNSHWEKVDSNKDNRVDFSEYFLWTMRSGWKEELLVSDSKERQVRELARKRGIAILDVERVRAVFDKYDTDKSGYIDKDEFKSVICNCMNVKDPSQVSQNMLNRYWKEADTGNDGEIDMPEFLSWYFKFFAK